jgi:hypothetical protein
MKNKYQCDHWNKPADVKQLGHICPSCHIALMNRHNRMLEILKFIAEDRDVKVIGGSPPAWIARELLKEIGET